MLVAARTAWNGFASSADAAVATPSPGVGIRAVSVPVDTAPTAAAVAMTLVRRDGPDGAGRGADRWRASVASEI